MFKKIGLLFMSALALGFVACDDIEDAIPQAYAPEAPMSLDGLTVEAGSDFAAGAVDLNVLESLNVVNTVTTPELKEGQTVEYKMFASASEDFAEAVEIDVVGGAVSATDIDNVFRAVKGKTDDARDLYFRFAAYLEYAEGAKVRFGEQDTYFAETKVAVTPIALGLPFVDTAYLLEANGEIVAEFKHVGGGDVYDNPNFSVKFTIAEDAIVEDEEWGESWFWRILAKDAEGRPERTVFAPGEDYFDAEEGTLETNANGVTPGYGNFPAPGKWVFSFNAETLAFTIEEAPAAMYMIGNFCGWSWDNAAEMVPVNSHDGMFWTIRYVKAGEGFKFNTNNDWDGGQFGAGTEIGECVAGAVSTDADGNLLVEKGGWYIFVIDSTSGAPVLSVLEPNVYVFGPANGGTWGATDEWKFNVVDDPDAEWPFVSPEVLATEGNDNSCLRLCVVLPGCDWWQSEFIFYDGEISYRGTGGDQARVGNAAGKVYLNFVTGKAKVE